MARDWWNNPAPGDHAKADKYLDRLEAESDEEADVDD